MKKEEEAGIEAVMAEGYKQMAEENLREAEEALNLTSEVMLRNQWPWPTDPLETDTSGRSSTSNRIR